MDISKEDLHGWKEELKGHINDKFRHHEEMQHLILEPMKKQIEEHDTILRGRDKQNGLVRDVGIQKWVAGTGWFAAVGSWVDKLVNKL